MPLYKHYSFDLWLTLIKSNPSFKTERAKYFHHHFNSRKKPIEEVIAVFRHVDLMVNSINEKTGKNIDADEMYLMVISIINDYATDFSSIDVDGLYNEMETLLFNYTPVLYCAEGINVLNKLKDSGKCSTNILSNTGFIKGKTLRKLLKQLELEPLLDFQLYSDEVRLSKPNPQFFQLMLQNIDRQRHPELELQEIIHVGDNPIADVRGAKQAGINSFLINSNQQSIATLLS
ncbi:HAD family hydrolase [Pedobacter sp.]|uniref:HAD family hydrolase n=1 Tax=Pedobacter sp. TaxID=1411316 RepID=UPI003D7F72B4